MKIIIFISLLILALTNCLAQQSKKSLNFKKFPSLVYKGKVASINLRSHPKARIYRTMLQLSIKDGVNFAGHYIVARWGCGSNCITVAIIDAKSGQVFFPSEFSEFGVGFEFKEGNDDNDLQYKLNSKLIIIEGIMNFYIDDASKVGKYYFVWDSNRLRPVLKEKRQWAGIK